MIEKERVEFGLFSTQISCEWHIGHAVRAFSRLAAIQGYCSFSSVRWRSRLKHLCSKDFIHLLKRERFGAYSFYLLLGLVARTRGSATTCSERNQTCDSFVRITSLTSRSFVPSSPSSPACLAMLRDSRRITSCA